VTTDADNQLSCCLSGLSVHSAGSECWACDPSGPMRSLRPNAAMEEAKASERTKGRTSMCLFIDHPLQLCLPVLQLRYQHLVLVLKSGTLQFDALHITQLIRQGSHGFLKVTCLGLFALSAISHALHDARGFVSRTQRRSSNCAEAHQQLATTQPRKLTTLETSRC
jgi:hypothetical protein